MTANSIYGYSINFTDKRLLDIAEGVRQKTETIEGQYEYWPVDGIITRNLIAPILTRDGYVPMRWGYTRERVKNYRTIYFDNAMTKVVLKRRLITRRCVIPVREYYILTRVKSSRTMYRVYNPDEDIYFAGCYLEWLDDPLYRFVILTKPLIEGIRSQNRLMPMVLKPRQHDAWINGYPSQVEYTPPRLSCRELPPENAVE